MKKLPNSLQAYVSRKKIVDYLLCMEHPDGSSKAKFFMRFGFSVANWSEMAEALRQHGQENPVADIVKSEYGVRYTVEGAIVSPDGRNPRVRTVWLVANDESIPRLITAHPA